MEPFSTDTIPTGIRYAISSSTQSAADPLHQLLDRVAREPGLHEVPVPEEHGVGDRAEEQGADEHAEQRERVRAADVRRGAEQRDRAGDRGEEIEPGIELAAHGGLVTRASLGSGPSRLVVVGRSAAVLVIAATRAARRAATSRWPRTPALRR